MSRSNPISALTSLALLVCLTVPATAQPKPDAVEAEKEYKIGKRAEELGNLRLAAIHYKRAYDLYPTPTLLYTLAHTHRLLGDTAIALDYYKQYVIADPRGPRVEAANKYIKLLGEATATEPKPEPGPEPEDVGPPDEREVQEAAASPAEPRRDGERSHTLRWVGVGVGVVGLAAVAAGIAYGLEAQSLADDVNNPGGTWELEELDKFDEGEAAERNQIIFTAAGAAMVAAGIVLVVLDVTRSEDRVAPAPVVGDGQVGLAVSGRF